jgi:hypothetical protein
MFHSPIAKVTPCDYRVYYNAKEDRKVSMHGSLPWLGGGCEADWELIHDGYTLHVEHKDGSVTYGLGRPPFPTMTDAAAFADKCNERIAS